MKLSRSFLLLALLFPVTVPPASGVEGGGSRRANTILLDETGVRNLRLETVVAEERTFEQTVFAIGRVEEIPGHQYAVSSRIAGRTVDVRVFAGDRVEKGETVVEVESRQPGDPPPVVALKAPASGLVTECGIVSGQPVEPQETLLRISDRSEMWVVARIPEQRARGIQKGSEARITFPAVEGVAITAKLERFGVRADREAGVIEGIFRVSNPEERLFPGMRAELQIVVASRPGILSVPREAIQGRPSAPVVYVKDFELPHAFVKSPVILGEKSNGWVEVKAGLFPGDEVVTRGAYLLGFAGAGGGGSLKEALDAAHGHAHAEDGSELTGPGSGHHAPGAEPPHHAEPREAGAPRWIVGYAGGVSVLMLLFARLWWSARRARGEGGHHA